MDTLRLIHSTSLYFTKLAFFKIKDFLLSIKDDNPKIIKKIPLLQFFQKQKGIFNNFKIKYRIHEYEGFLPPS